MTSTSLVPALRRWLTRDHLLRVWQLSRKPLAWLIGVTLALQGLLALGLPWLIQGPGLRAASQALHRQVSLDRARFNPFTLTLRLHGLRIQDPAPSSADFVTAERITIDLSIASLLRWAPVLDAVHIEAPHITLVRTDATHFNISDLLTEFTADNATPASSPPRFALHDLVVHGGELHFDDPTQKVHHAIQHIEFSVPYVANFKGDEDTTVKPLLSAQVHGGELRLGAETKPFKATRETTLHLSLKGLDLMAALRGLPALAPWQVDRGALDTQWQVTLRAAPANPAGDKAPAHTMIVAQGQVDVRQLALHNPHGDHLSWEHAHIGSEQLRLTLDPQALQWQMGEGHLSLNTLKIQDTQDAAHLLSLAALKLDHIAIDSAQRQVTLGEIQSDGLQVQAHRRSDGRLNLLNMLDRLPSGGPTQTAAPPTHAAPPLPASTPWHIDIHHLGLQHTDAQWLDETSTPPVQAGVKGLQGDIRHLSTRANAKIDFDLHTDLLHGGSLTLQGQAQSEPRQVHTELHISGLNLAVAQPYLSQALNLQLSKGRLDTQGKLSVEAPASGDLRVAYRGQAAIDDLYTREPDTDDDFLRWKRLTATDIDIGIAPLAPSAKDHLRVGALTLQDLFAKIVINKAGRINLQDILRQPATPAKAPVATTAPSPRVDLPLIELGGLKIAGGRLNFSDQFIKPNYTANITDLRGTVSAVGTRSPPAQVALQGRVEGDAPLTIQGRVNPVAAALFIDISAKARGIDLPMLTPYATKYTGYPIQRGKLSLDVNYKIENGQLQAQNSIFLDQLTFGERVDSPTATQLPVLFAVSLLKNSRGEIDLRLPVSGSLNDPQFSVGAVIGQVLGNLVKRAVTAPFTLLASMFSGGASDFSAVTFNPGTAELSAESLPKLDKLSKALVDRPALKLDITAHIDPVSELGEIRRARLMARLQAERRKANPNDSAADTDPTRWDERDYGQWLQRVYDNTSVANKPRNVIGIAKKIPLSDMEGLLMSAITVSDDELRTLAQARAAAVRKVLGENVPVERLFTLAPVIVAAPKGPDAAPTAATDECNAACVAFNLH